MILPPFNEAEWRRKLEQADAANHKRNQDIEVGGGRVIFTDQSTSARYQAGIEYGALVVRDMDGNEVSASADIRQAERFVLSTYGDTVSVAAKGKNLNKFGTNSAVGTSFETVAQFQGTELNETFVNTNLIDSIVSSDAGDTQVITIEGHTIDGSGNLTFTVQNATLTGQTEVTLATPLARATRAYVANSGVFNSTPAALAGTVYVYDNTDGIASGVPVTAAATKLLIQPGETQSQKCATSVSSTDYWFVTSFDAGIGAAGGAANRVQVRLEARDVVNGGAWRPVGRDLTLDVDQNGVQQDERPFIVIPKNHDVRVVAKTDTNTAAIFAEIRGYLAVIV